MIPKFAFLSDLCVDFQGYPQGDCLNLVFFHSICFYRDISEFHFNSICSRVDVALRQQNDVWLLKKFHFFADK